MAEQLENTGAFTRGLVFGALLGGVVGAVTALLLAPKSGQELRRDIAQHSTDIYNKATDYFVDYDATVKNAVSNTMNQGKQRAQNIINSAKIQAEQLLSNAEQVLKDAKSKATSAKDNLTDKIDQVKNAAKAGAEAFNSELNS